MKIINGEPYMSKDEAIRHLADTTEAMQKTRTQLRQAQEDCVHLAQYSGHLEQLLAAIKQDAETCMPGVLHHVLTPARVKAALGRIAQAAAPIQPPQTAPLALLPNNTEGEPS